MFIYGDTYKNVLECSLIMSFYHMVILRITKLINIAKKKKFRCDIYICQNRCDYTLAIEDAYGIKHLPLFQRNVLNTTLPLLPTAKYH